MNNNSPLQSANNAALRLLSYRPRAVNELRTRLLLKRFSASIVDEVVELLTIEGLLDDGSFARVWLGSRQRLSPRSASLIKRELSAKGVSRETIDDALVNISDDENAYRAGLKYSRRLGQADFVNFRRKLWAYLQRRGFSSAISRRTVARLWQEEEAIRPPQPER